MERKKVFVFRGSCRIGSMFGQANPSDAPAKNVESEQGQYKDYTVFVLYAVAAKNLPSLSCSPSQRSLTRLREGR